MKLFFRPSLAPSRSSRSADANSPARDELLTSTRANTAGSRPPRNNVPAVRWPTVVPDTPVSAQQAINDPTPTNGQRQHLDSQARSRNVELEALRAKGTAAPPQSLIDERQAAYLLARQVDGRPVDGELRDMLLRGHETRKEVRSLMHVGRGNVRTDTEATSNASFRINEATRDEIASFNARHGMLSEAEMAGVIAHSGAGNCGEYASMTEAVHAARLQRGESIEQVKQARRDHVWNVLKGSDHEVMIDSWSDAPTMDAADSTRMKRRNRLNVLHATERDRARVVTEEFNTGKDSTGPELQKNIDRRRAALDALDLKPSRLVLRNPGGKVRKSFADRAREALERGSPPSGQAKRDSAGIRMVVQKAKSLLTKGTKATVQSTKPRIAAPVLPKDLRNQVLAAGAARSIGANVRQATESAPRIVQQAKRLRDATPSTPLGEPPSSPAIAEESKHSAPLAGSSPNTPSASLRSASTEGAGVGGDIRPASSATEPESMESFRSGLREDFPWVTQAFPDDT